MEVISCLPFFSVLAKFIETELWSDFASNGNKKKDKELHILIKYCEVGMLLNCLSYSLFSLQFI